MRAAPTDTIVKCPAEREIDYFDAALFEGVRAGHEPLRVKVR
jgi:hypothetical protein